MSNGLSYSQPVSHCFVLNYCIDLTKKPNHCCAAVSNTTTAESVDLRGVYHSAHFQYNI